MPIPSPSFSPPSSPRWWRSTAYYGMRIAGYLNRTESRPRKREQELPREVYDRTKAESEENQERLRPIEACGPK